MKKIFFSCLAIAAIASCAKTEPTFIEADSEIKIAPVTAISTKAQQGVMSTTEYNKNEDFSVYAYWANEAAGSEFTQDETTEGAYLNDVKFVNKGNYWGGETAYYWPKNGSIRFAAYSPADLTGKVAHTLATDVYTINGLEYPTDLATTYDILVSPTSTSYTAETAAEKVSVKFEHALSWITFQMKSTVEANNAFTVTDVIVNDVNNIGNMVADMKAGTKTWTTAASTNPAPVVNVFNYAAGWPVTTTATVFENADAKGNRGLSVLVLPQKPTTVTIKYTQEAMAGTPKLENQVITVPLVLDNADDNWEAGKKYTYTVLFDLDEILINPTVEDWEETTEVIVNSDPVKVNTSAELVAAVAEGKDVVLEQSITLDEPVIVEPVVATKAETVLEVTIDLNGKDIIAPLFAESNGTISVGNTDSYAFWVKKGAKLTINGNGNVTTQACKYSIAVWADGGEVVINGGTYANDEEGEGSDLIYAKNGGKVSIYGGEFIANTKKEGTDGTNEKRSALNLHGNTTGNEIVVYGGRFFEFDPSNNASENPAENFCADGYAAYNLGDGWYEVAAKTAPVEVATAAALQSVVGQGGSAVLTADITMKDILVMSGNAVLDGNGFTLTSTAGRAINVSGGNAVTIKDLTINASGERGINIIQDTKNVQIENVTATAANYAVNVAGSASGANVSIADSDLTGLNTINIAATKVVVTVTNTKITCADNTDVESYGAISCAPEAVGSKVTVNGGEVVVNGDSVAASQAAAGSVIAFIGTKGDTRVRDAYFAIKYGNYAYTFVDFESALNKAVDGETIILTQDVNEVLEVPAGKDITIDLNGHTLTSTGVESLVNNGTLTLKNGKVTAANTEDTRRCVYNYGTMTIDGVEFVQTYGARGAAINNEGVMVITNATVNSVYYAIWNSGADAVLTVNGGTFNCVGDKATWLDTDGDAIDSAAWCYAVRNQNGATMTVNDGNFYGNHGVIASYGSAAILNGGTYECFATLTGNSDWVFFTDNADSAKITYDANACEVTTANPNGAVYGNVVTK